MGFALVLVVGMFAFTSLVLDAGFHFEAALPALVAAALGCGAFTALGLISASFVLAFKRGDPVGGVLNMAGLIFAGAYFPRELLPEVAQRAAQFLPHTHLLTALRSALLDGAGFGDVELVGALARLAISAVVLGVLAVATWNHALRHARRAGTLTDA
jgi:ABC-2 type transport system permease protein